MVLFKLRVHNESPGVQVGLTNLHKLHLPVDAGTTVPSIRRADRVVHPHGDEVLPFPKMFRDIQSEAGVAVLLLPRLSPVDPHGAVLVFAAKGEKVAMIYALSLKH